MDANFFLAPAWGCIFEISDWILLDDNHRSSDTGKPFELETRPMSKANLSAQALVKESPAIVEESPVEGPDELTMKALEQRIFQQEILSDIGVFALRNPSFDELMHKVVALIAEGLDVQLCKVLEFRPEQNDFIVRAGIGWHQGVVGHATIGADLASPAGFALKTDRPVISNHLENEERFRTPDLLREHGVKRAMNVILQGDERPYGVLEADSRSEQDFAESDLAFLQGAANILGMAIERSRNDSKLKQAFERQDYLMKEMNHRVKNSLAIVTSVLRLQSNAVKNKELTEQLEKACFRVNAIAHAHQQLYLGAELHMMDVGTYIDAMCKDLAIAAAPHKVFCSFDRDILLSTDKAVSCALIVNELVTNALKYAYEGFDFGTVQVSVKRLDADHFSISVIDKGHGLPIGFDAKSKTGLGMKIIRNFAAQLGTDLIAKNTGPGTHFVLTIPLHDRADRQIA